MPATRGRSKTSRAAVADDEAVVKKQFVEKLFKGRIMSQKDLEALRRRKKLDVPDRKLRAMPYHKKPSAVRKLHRKAVAFASTAFPHFGHLHTDFAYYKPENADENDGMQGGLL